LPQRPAHQWGCRKVNKAFDNLLSRIAAQNPNTVVRGRHRPVFRPGETRPSAVEHRIVVDGKEVFKILTTNE
jgi:hypothetical protein